MALVRLLWLALIFFCVDVTQSKRFFLAQRSLSFVYGRTPVFLFSCRELSRARVHDRNSRVPSQILHTRPITKTGLGKAGLTRQARALATLRNTGSRELPPAPASIGK